MSSNLGFNTGSNEAAGSMNVPSQDARGIEQRVSDFAAAWNQHDAAKMAACWMDDGDLINPAGRLARGRDQVEQLFRDEHQHVMKSSSNQMRVGAIRKIGNDLAFVDTECTITGMRTHDLQELPPWKVHVPLFMCKDQGTWKIMAARPCVFTAMPGPSQV